MIRFLLVLAALAANHAVAESSYRFAVVPKEQSPFFDASRDGCMQAAADLGVECIYRGSAKIDIRKQDAIINTLVDEGVDGIAVAVIQSEFILESSIKRALAANIPVITYDADFDAEALARYPHARLAYVGTDNVALGMALGESLRELLPDGGKVIIQSGRPDAPNLNLRVMGVRQALSGTTYNKAPGFPVRNQNGFNEFGDLHLNFGSVEKAIDDLEVIMKNHQSRGIDGFVAVGGWAQFSGDYAAVMSPYLQALQEKSIVLVFADAVPVQLEYLKKGLAHRNVGQNPYEMGRQAIRTLLKIKRGEPYKKVQYTPLMRCNPDNAQTCTLNRR